jgi:pSer/pThr/pTyr-binding forkhead associated (FHA) protein
MKPFLKACGADGPLLLNVDGKDWVFPRPFLVIGRDPRADFVLDHPDVSRRHVYLQLVDGHLFCFDLGSRTGIQWDGGTSAHGGWLDAHRSLRIGPYTISRSIDTPGVRQEAENPAERPNPLETPFHDTPLLMETALESPRGVVERRRNTVHRINRVLSLMGRAPRCEPYLSDPSVSWLHCSLLRTPMGTWVIDLLGRGGISVNGVSVRFAQLANGDELGVGYHLIRVQLGDGFPIADRREGRRFPTTSRVLALDVPPAADRLGQPSVAINSSAWTTDVPPVASTSRVIAQASRLTPLAPILEPEISLRNPVPAEIALTNDSLMAVMNQFGQQQQQMLEQFLQTMMTVFQMSNSMHRETQESIRRELGQFCKLTEELSEVRAELASLRLSTSSATPQTNGKMVLPNARERRPSPERPLVEGKAPAEPRADPAEPARPLNTAATQQGDFYDWLSHRMETLQTEQQSRWQNLMNLMLGRQHGGATP